MIIIFVSYFGKVLLFYGNSEKREVQNYPTPQLLCAQCVRNLQDTLRKLTIRHVLLRVTPSDL
jgi:hypothetical protein